MLRDEVPTDLRQTVGAFAVRCVAEPLPPGPLQGPPREKKRKEVAALGEAAHIPSARDQESPRWIGQEALPHVSLLVGSRCGGAT